MTRQINHARRDRQFRSDPSRDAFERRCEKALNQLTFIATWRNLSEKQKNIVMAVFRFVQSCRGRS